MPRHHRIITGRLIRFRNWIDLLHEHPFCFWADLELSGWVHKNSVSQVQQPNPRAISDSCLSITYGDFGKKCMWDAKAHKCNNRCHPHQCSSCTSQSECRIRKTCVWDTKLNFCVSKCYTAESDIALGLGCWTCETEFLCTHPDNSKSAQKINGCSWSKSIQQCIGPNTDGISPHYGNIINPNDKDFFHIDSVAGNVYLHHSDVSVEAISFTTGVILGVSGKNLYYSENLHQDSARVFSCTK